MFSRRADSPDPLSRSAFESTTLIQLLRRRASSDVSGRAYTFLADSDNKEVSLSYQELDRKARAIAALLQSLFVAGERALLLYPPGIEFIPSLFGCIYSGVIAVPAYPPEPSRLNRSLPRLQAIVTDADAKVVLTTSPMLSLAKFLFAQAPELEKLRWIATDNLDARLEDGWREIEVEADTAAFIQYTSGSTGVPKGVILSHRNLLHNARLVYEAVEHTPSDTYLSWLPLFHDMGLMAGVLQPLYASLPVTLMSPIAFLQKPVRWLQALSQFKATTSGGPNFAYDLCVRKINDEERVGLDLSSWTVAFNGAEPIRSETLKRFAATFAPYGFRQEAFYPCYGLAEATLIVSGGRKARPPRTASYSAAQLDNNHVTPVVEGQGARTLVSCGEPLGNQSVLIVNPDSLTPCAPDEIGEIWVSGPSVASGYWNKPDATEEVFKARLSATGEGPFLRTGDMGFFRKRGLYITGRLKDLIIVRGRNHYPQDIELTVERAHRAFRPGCGAAFSIEDIDEERLAIVQEVEANSELDLNDLIRTIRAAVANEHEVQVDAIALIKPGSIPKTSSGKIQRHACRAAFLQSNLDLIAQWRREAVDQTADSIDLHLEGIGNIKDWIISQVAARIGVSPSEIDDGRPLTDYGLDSLAAIELAHSLETHAGVTLPMVSFIDGRSIEQLTSPIAANSEDGFRGAVSVHTEIEPVHGEHPLSFGQRALWFLQHLSPENSANNIASALRVRGNLDAELLRRAFQALVDRHACLRTTFPAFDGEPVQRVAERAELFFHYEDASTWDHVLLNDRLVKEAHRPFRLDTGPLLRLNLFKRSPDHHILLLVVHHIIADFWSLGVLVDELAQLYEAEKSGSLATLTPLTLQYHDYVRSQIDMLNGETGERLWAYWKDKLAGELPLLALPTDHPRPRVQTYTGNSQSFKLSAETTRSLKALAQANGATLYMTLLAAFEAFLCRYTAQEDIVIGSPSAGRRSAEMANVVGYFVNPLVLRSKVDACLSFESLLATVRKDVLEAFEHQDYPFALLVERLRPQRDLSRSPIFQVMFVLQKARRHVEQGLEAFALSEAGASIKLGRLTFESVRLEQRIAQFDLMLMMAEVQSTEFDWHLRDCHTYRTSRGAGLAQTRPPTPVTGSGIYVKPCATLMV